MTTLPVPFPHAYWVIPGKLLAGFYPGSKDPKESTANSPPSSILAFGTSST